MTEVRSTLAARLDALINKRKPGAPADALPVITAAPLPGFRFGLGDPVIELVTGQRGTIRAAYYGAAARGPLYEIRIDGIGIVARLEREVEPDRSAGAPPPPSSSR